VRTWCDGHIREPKLIVLWCPESDSSGWRIVQLLGESCNGPVEVIRCGGYGLGALSSKVAEERRKERAVDVVGEQPGTSTVV